VTDAETAAILFLLAGILIELVIFAMQVKPTLERIETKLDAIGKR
jgi:hypothetical protein